VFKFGTFKVGPKLKSLNVELSELQIEFSATLADTNTHLGTCTNNELNGLQFSNQHNFVETITLVIPAEYDGDIIIEWKILGASVPISKVQKLAAQEVESDLTLIFGTENTPDEAEQDSFAMYDIRIEVVDSSLGDEKYMPSDKNHPLTAHQGGKPQAYEECCGSAQLGWDPGFGLECQNFAGLYQHGADEWNVPAPGNTSVSELSAPPVKNVTAVYGVNLETPRTLFVRHRHLYKSGGMEPQVESRFQLDYDGDVDGLRVIDGIGYETQYVPQICPDDPSGDRVYASGDGTVNYQSLRWPMTWQSERCQVNLHELPGCDHRGVSTDNRMKQILCNILKIGDQVENDSTESKQYSARVKNSIDAWTRNRVCRCVSKMGFRRLNRFRQTT